MGLDESYQTLRMMIVSAGCALFVTLGGYLVISSMSLFGSDDLGRALVGITAILAGCTLYLHYIAISIWWRACLLGLLSTISALVLAYWVVLPVSDRLLVRMPALAMSGTLSIGLAMLVLVIALNMSFRLRKPNAWLVALASMILMGCLLAGSEAAALAFRESTPLFLNGTSFRLSFYAAVSWVFVTWTFHTAAPTKLRSDSTEKGSPK